ncbi:MAG: HU family DNA-binding protein [Bacteroidales bacterium]|jgi:predicted histone-like DNA-binding protein|nr:HU family DNA-binding protein [Bacteroidales bacterium]
MALGYKVVQKGQPGVTGGGEKKYYAQIVNGREVTVDEMAKSIEKFSALSEADILSVIRALENTIQKELSDGKIIRLDKLGSLYPKISSNGEESAKKVTSKSIKSIGVNYRPGKRIINSMKEAGFSKVG